MTSPHPAGCSWALWAAFAATDGNGRAASAPSAVQRSPAAWLAERNARPPLGTARARRGPPGSIAPSRCVRSAVVNASTSAGESTRGSVRGLRSGTLEPRCERDCGGLPRLGRSTTTVLPAHACRTGSCSPTLRVVTGRATGARRKARDRRCNWSARSSLRTSCVLGTHRHERGSTQTARSRRCGRDPVVEVIGFEPTAPSLRTKCSARLSYTPIFSCRGEG